MKLWPSGKTAIICCRVGDPNWKPSPTSQDKNCFNCDSPIKVSDSSFGWYEKEPSEFVCVECADEYAKLAGRPFYLLPNSPMQSRERGEKILNREEFIEEYVKTHTKYNDEEDSLELRELAGKIYDANH